LRFEMLGVSCICEQLREIIVVDKHFFQLS
jgi:hypothetical protein